MVKRERDFYHKYFPFFSQQDFLFFFHHRFSFFGHHRFSLFNFHHRFYFFATRLSYHDNTTPIPTVFKIRFLFCWTFSPAVKQMLVDQWKSYWTSIYCLLWWYKFFQKLDQFRLDSCRTSSFFIALVLSPAVILKIAPTTWSTNPTPRAPLLTWIIYIPSMNK